MSDISVPKTQPLPRFYEGQIEDPNSLAAGRYGTGDMCDIWGPEKTVAMSLEVHGTSAKVLSQINPEVVSPEDAQEIQETANRGVDMGRVRELEGETGHDVIAINQALGERLSPSAQTHINKGKTSADTTQPVRALQLKTALEVIMIVTENLRDILCEKAQEWKNVPFMDTSHLYDALPTTAGRPLAHYVEMLQSNLDRIKFTHKKSIIGKWGDATGNHHSATALGINGIELQENFCDELGVGYMDASAQIPGLEFEADVVFAMARLTETMNNIAQFIALGRSDDVNVFINANPKRNKGSSAMPHKDAKNGNPSTEEQMKSLRNYMAGNLTTAMMNCEMPYARNLAASANARINFEDGFKWLDHGIRNLAKTIFWIELRENRSIERVQRSFGVVTSQQVMTYLTDSRETDSPMSREDAHDLMGTLAQKAWDTETEFVDVVLGCEDVTRRLDETTIRDITDPLKYIGQSTEIIDLVVDKYYQKKTV